MSVQYYILFIPLLPLITFVLLGLFGKKYFSRLAGIAGTTSVLFSALLSFYTAYQYFFVSGKINGAYQKVVPGQVVWLPFSKDLSIDMGLLLDPVSVMMLVVVTFVSLMVHLFSIGYMKGEQRYTTYFAFLSLFTFSMLGLVLSSNLFQLYIFWELVGVSSFLLISFYYERPSAVAAAKKAFIITRFADLGFLIGILILGVGSGTFDINGLIERLTATGSPQALALTATSFLGVSLFTWGLSLLFIGGAGKSALFPLHVWLPDAMEGPTPVSALIHAATMVVAGVYLVARLFPLYAINHISLAIVTWAGILSAVFAAIVACTQIDIKRVLAYSTMSQIGYMMFALGVGLTEAESNSGFTASLFHLFTHAFFKSLLFLCAGLIIHAVHTNDITQMGGLRQKLPLTHAAFLTGCLAISGIPPFSGFFSKEAILFTAFSANKPVFVLALATSALTAFYMFRLYFLVFWKISPAANSSLGSQTEGPASLRVPVIILALCSVVAGFVPFGVAITPDGRPAVEHFSWSFSIAPVLLAAGAIGLAAYFYKNESNRPAKGAAALGNIYRWAAQKFFVDEAYRFITQKIIVNGMARPAAWFDRFVIDGMVNGIGTLTTLTAQRLKSMQSGHVQHYALVFFGGVAALVIVFIYLWK